jgi:hypothetical protein
MSRFNKPGIPSRGPTSPIKMTETRLVTNEGYVGYQRDVFSELFLLAASFMGGDDNFYEKSDDRYKRLIRLTTDAEVLGEPEWVFHFVTWLRNDANLRTVSMVIALEYVKARMIAGEVEPFHVVKPRVFETDITNRDIVSAALQRADEPAEAIAYCLTKDWKPIPQAIKSGVGDAARKLYNEFSFLKYGNSRTKSVSMIDVLRLTHPVPQDTDQDALFKYITSKDREAVLRTHALSTKLSMIRARKKLYDIPKAERTGFGGVWFKDSGMTWENVSEWNPNGMDAEAWEAMIPNMGVMALLRNLRNFDQAGINRPTRFAVQAKISDPEVVRKSKQLPFRWYNAYRATDSLNYASALEDALDISLENIPKLKGKTLVLVDMSGSMFQGKVSAQSNVTYADAAALFGAALKLRNPDGVDLYQFGSEYRELATRYMNHDSVRFSNYGSDKWWTGVTQKVELGKGGSILRSMEKFYDMGGTRTHQAIEETFRPEHDRLILITDEQAGYTSIHSHYDELPVPAGKRVYIWNLAGYQAGVSKSGKYQRHTFGGLNDQAFRMIPILEAGQSVGWPWEGSA